MTRFAAREFGLRPKMCRPSANTENSRCTREKPLVNMIINQVKWTKFSLQCESNGTDGEQTAKNCLPNPKFQQDLKFYAVAIYPAAGKGLYKKLNARQSENLREFLQNVFFLAFESILFSFRELPSNQENKNGLAAERLWFLGHRVESMTFRHL